MWKEARARKQASKERMTRLARGAFLRDLLRGGREVGPHGRARAAGLDGREGSPCCDPAGDELLILARHPTVLKEPDALVLARSDVSVEGGVLRESVLERQVHVRLCIGGKFGRPGSEHACSKLQGQHA